MCPPRIILPPCLTMGLVVAGWAVPQFPLGFPCWEVRSRGWGHFLCSPPIAPAQLNGYRVCVGPAVFGGCGQDAPAPGDGARRELLGSMSHLGGWCSSPPPPLPPSPPPAHPLQMCCSCAALGPIQLGPPGGADAPPPPPGVWPGSTLGPWVSGWGSDGAGAAGAGSGSWGCREWDWLYPVRGAAAAPGVDAERGRWHPSACNECPRVPWDPLSQPGLQAMGEERGAPGVDGGPLPTHCCVSTCVHPCKGLCTSVCVRGAVRVCCQLCPHVAGVICVCMWGSYV